MRKNEKTAKNSLVEREIEEEKIDPALTLKSLFKANYKKIQASLGEGSNAFVSTVLSMYQLELSGVTPESVMSVALQAANLNLPLNKELGFAYIVSYKNNDKGIKEATLQLGWRGIVQLALRSGEVAKLNAIPIRENELGGYNPLTETLTFNYDPYSDGVVVGYASFLETVKGFKKTIYMTKGEVDKHARKYSKSYQYDKNKRQKKSQWSTNFDEMACKTLLKRVLRFAPLSVSIQNSIANDGVIKKVEKVVADELSFERATPGEIKELLKRGDDLGVNVTEILQKKYKKNSFENLSAKELYDLQTIVEVTGETN